MSKPIENKNQSGGIAQFFVEHREVSWLALIAVLVWGAVAYTRLGQQEDPTIPQRTAMLVTQFPGATASKVEELVSKPLERKISELKSIEEIKSTSRPGISTMTIKQLPGSTATIDLEWDKVRAKLFEVQLPDGARQPWLNTDFGNTITLLFGLVSPPITDAECVARANVLRETLADLRKGISSTNRAAVSNILSAVHFAQTALSRNAARQGSKRQFVRLVLQRKCGPFKASRSFSPTWQHQRRGQTLSTSLPTSSEPSLERTVNCITPISRPRSC